MTEESLKHKTIKGVAWSALENITRLGVTFFVSIILARLLSPDEYGLIGILTIFISMFNTMVDSGFSNALIRKQNVSDVDYSTVFYINLVLSVILALILFCTSRLIAIFFERPELLLLTKVMSCVVIINAFSIVQRVRVTKRLDFKTLTKVTLIASVGSGIIGILLAFNGYGVWALVWQQISNQFITTLLFWIYNRWVPDFIFSFSSFKDLWSFGSKLLASSLLATAWGELYKVVIGKCYSSTTLGLYTRAVQFSELCSSNLTSVVQRVSYPVFSSIQDDRFRLKQAYKRVIKTTMFPTFVLMLGMAASSDSIIRTLLGVQWIECVPMLQIVCFSGMLYPLHALNLNMLQVQGRSDLFLKLEIIKKIIAIGPLILGIFFNIHWMLIGSVIIGIFSYYLNAYYSGPFLNYSIKEQVKDIFPSFMIAIIIATPVYMMSFLSINSLLLLVLQIIVGVLSIIGICELTKFSTYIEIKEIVTSLVKTRFNK